MGKERKYLKTAERDELLSLQEQIAANRRKQPSSISFMDRKIIYGWAGATIKSIDELLNLEVIGSKHNVIIS